jgi:hypothetical protein
MQAILWFIRQLSDDDPVKVYLESVLKSAQEERDADASSRLRWLTLLLGTYGLGRGEFNHFETLEIREFDRVKGMLLEFANLYRSNRPGDRVWHDLYLGFYEEHTDIRGRSHEVPVPPTELDQRSAATCEEATSELPNDECGVKPPLRWSLDQLLPVLEAVSEVESPEGRDIIESIRRMCGMPSEAQLEMFKKNGAFNRSAFRRFMGSAAPDHHTITRVLRRIQDAARMATPSGRLAAASRAQANPYLALEENMQPNSQLTLARSTPGATSIPETMLNGLYRLSEVYGQRLRYPHDDTLRIRLGYLCTQLGRQAATDVYELVTRVDAVAPGLSQTADSGQVASSLLTFLKQVMSGEILRDPDDPLLRLMAILRTGGNLFSVGEAAIRSAVALLGLNEFGGVLAAWQLQALAFTLMGWDDHVAFNERILKYARRLYPTGACEAARKYELPDLDYLAAGCQGNVVNASYRIVITDPDQGRRRAARAVGDETLGKLEGECSPELKETMLISCLQVIRAACAAILGDDKAAHQHWAAIPRSELPRILDDLGRTEPCAQVREQVAETARAAFNL